MVGTTAATMSGDFIEGGDWLELGFAAGIAFDQQLSDRFSLVAGLSMIQKGGRRLQLSTDSDTTYGFQTAYLELPILVRAAFDISGRNWYLAPVAGLSVGYNLSCGHKPGDRLTFTKTCDEEAPGGVVEKFELAVPVGVHFWRQFEGGSRVLLELQYEIGLTNTFSAATDAGQTARNNVWLFRFGFAVSFH